MIKIFVVDDHKIVRDGIKAMLLGHNGYKFSGESATGYKAMELMKKNPADVLILDINLPEASGLELIEEFLSRFPGLKIIMLTANIDEESVTASIKAGAHGFLHKDTSEEEFLMAIDTVFRTNEPFFGERISQIIYKSFVSKTRNSSDPCTKTQTLTAREQEVLKMLADGQNCSQIADVLFISSRTVETHKKHLMEKLELKNLADIVKYAIKNGLTQ